MDLGLKRIDYHSETMPHGSANQDGPAVAHRDGQSETAITAEQFQQHLFAFNRCSRTDDHEFLVVHPLDRHVPHDSDLTLRAIADVYPLVISPTRHADSNATRGYCPRAVRRAGARLTT